MPAKSRLPRLQSSPPPTRIPAPKMAGLKRKAVDDEEDQEEQQPRKVPAIAAAGNANRPIKPLQQRATRSVSAAASTRTGIARPAAGAAASTAARNGPAGRQPTTRGTMATRSTTRGKSAPLPTAAARPLAKSTTAARAPGGRGTTLGPIQRGGSVAQGAMRIGELQTQLGSIENARAADNARLSAEMAAERAKVAELQANHMAVTQELALARSQELNQRRELHAASDIIEDLKKKHEGEIMELEQDSRRKAKEIRELTEDLRVCRQDLDRERATVSALKVTVSQQSTAHLTLTSQNNALQAQNSALQSQLDTYSQNVSDLALKLEYAQKEIEKLKIEAMESEAVRRKLHNMVQELKGNIRVFCRVRPVLSSDLPSGTLPPAEVERRKKDLQANMTFPDKFNRREIAVEQISESATGQERREVYNFNFDRVFEPDSTQAEVFEEVSQLAQSCIDGYNVCIFAYGQTGSGKSFTMEGGSTDTTCGMIPRAVEQVFRVAEFMKTKGWEYKLEGQFLEIYNETINDLLGKHEFDKKKHEIKHDPKTGSTRVTDVNVVPLHSPSQVRSLLALAQSRRSVASTLVNERSSRSHSVFTLRISGVHVGLPASSGDSSAEGVSVAVAGTGEKCEGSLNLVDLAGSERLNVSFANGADKERVRETQNINKSLSALGDVIAALGEKADKADKHIPYRNSKVRCFCFIDVFAAKFVEWEFEDVDDSQCVAVGDAFARVFDFAAVRHQGEQHANRHSEEASQVITLVVYMISTGALLRNLTTLAEHPTL
ncbi:hypothetical protein AX16_005844 [Volvariella volvacea WC 439]|nr:hypothetical protein AX16_005844 [Volvariella volvacea WC 439]